MCGPHLRVGPIHYDRDATCVEYIWYHLLPKRGGIMCKPVWGPPHVRGCFMQHVIQNNKSFQTDI